MHTPFSFSIITGIAKFFHAGKGEKVARIFAAAGGTLHCTRKCSFDFRFLELKGVGSGEG